MARIAGVKTTKNASGKLTHVTIDVRKHPQAIGTLKEMGLLNKTQFEKECEEAIPVDVFFDKLKSRIKQYKWSK